jgi:hypothetical protein
MLFSLSVINGKTFLPVFARDRRKPRDAWYIYGVRYRTTVAAVSRASM